MNHDQITGETLRRCIDCDRTFHPQSGLMGSQKCSRCAMIGRYRAT